MKTIQLINFRLMENQSKEKRTWQTPEIEVINSKMTKGGGHGWHMEGGNYYDVYSSS
jgi:hypothetical protein